MDDAAGRKIGEHGRRAGPAVGHPLWAVPHAPAGTPDEPWFSSDTGGPDSWAIERARRELADGALDAFASPVADGTPHQLALPAATGIVTKQQP